MKPEYDMNNKSCEMIEKYFYIDKQTAHALLEEVVHTKATKRGIDRHAFLLGDYAVLSTNRLKLRNVITRDDSLKYLDEIIHTLYALQERGVAVIPVLGYCYDPGSRDGSGYIFQQRAKGEELYDDAVMTKFHAWAQNNPDGVYLSTSLSDRDAAQYLLTRTHTVSQIPQEHFDSFIYDMLQILSEDILIDCGGQSNFFYDSSTGFQFIDLDSHNDYKYGLTSHRPDINNVICLCGFTPCHYAEGTELFSHAALSKQAIRLLSDSELYCLKSDNQIIFDKCKTAIKHNGIPSNNIESVLKRLKIFGC